MQQRKVLDDDKSADYISLSAYKGWLMWFIRIMGL